MKAKRKRIGVLITAICFSVFIVAQRDTHPEIIVDDTIEQEFIPKDEPLHPKGGIEKKNIATDIANIAGEEFDSKKKSEIAVRLVEKGINFLSKNSATKAFQAFNSNKEFLLGELYLFVFDSNGICLSHGQDNSLIWKNLYNLKSPFGVPIVQHILKEGLTPTNNGWVTYFWRGATKISYVQKVIKDKKTYVIGAGYYPHSKSAAVENLVKSAVTFFNDTIKNKQPKDAVFSTIGYPLGRFVVGDLYLYALSFDGTHVAHGDTPGLIGTNGMNYRDATGKFVNQEIIQQLKSRGSGGVWVDYVSKNAPKRAYAEKVVDEKGQEYFIACGYYPTTTRKKVVELVKKGYQYMKGNGKTQAAKMFSDQRNNDFRYGDLYLVVYDIQGNCIAHGNYPDMIGINRLNVQDENGEYYIRAMIEQSKNGPCWIDYKSNNSYKSAYVERLSLGTEEYIITSGIYPLSKFEQMYLLARSGIDYLKSNTEEQAYSAFVDSDTKFVRGDLFIFAIDSDGICFSYGPDERDLIWHNLMTLKDDTGKQFVKTIINHTMRGAGTVTYTLRGNKHIVYAEPVKKSDKTIIVGSGYFL